MARAWDRFFPGRRRCCQQPQAQAAPTKVLPPFPSQQLFILALCRICEPIAFMSVFPYVYYMVESFDVTSDPRKIAVYVGMITSSFTLAEFSTGMIWGRISDRIGRKPVLLMGLAGTALSVMVFGLAPSLPIALLGRALGGLLNGNMGVLQTTVAELVQAKEHQPRAYSIMPFIWCLGSILGPAMGGMLAMPCKNYPSIFSRGTLFDRYPFLLPNIVCALILVGGVTIGFLFLEETHEDKRHRRDVGLELGKVLLHRCRMILCQNKQITYDRFGIDEKKGEAYYGQISMTEGSNPMDDQLPQYSITGADVETQSPPPGYRSKDGTPRTSSSSATDRPSLSSGDILTSKKDKSANKAFTRQVVLIIAAFGVLAYHSISFDQLMPIFLAEPTTSDTFSKLTSPFAFTGGFGYSSRKIGFMLSVQGIYSMLAQLFIFPFCARTFGTLRPLRTVLFLWPVLYFLVPYLVLLPGASTSQTKGLVPNLQLCAVYLALLTKITFHVLAFPSVAILLANAAPSNSVLGLVNGASASTASLARALGPTLTGILHTWGLQLGSTGLAWWASGLVCALGALESLWIKDERSNNGPCQATYDTSSEPQNQGVYGEKDKVPLLHITDRTESLDDDDLV